MRKLALAVISVAIPYQATANDTDIAGMYRLVSEQRKIVDTGEIVAGSGSQGFLSYDKKRPDAGCPDPLSTAKP